ncbi:MAG: C4-dicarboxylate TRAP transporter substrate-binding protein [Hyphomicrobiaceae bacterium]
MTFGKLGAISAAAAAAFLASAAHAQKVDGPSVTWNISHWGKPRAASANNEALAKILDERTGGKFKIKVHMGEALSKARENLDGIKLGAFQMANFCNFYHPGKTPAWMVLALPFLPLDSYEVSAPVRVALYQHPLFVKDMAAWNAMPYVSTHLPQYELLGKGKEPKKLEDFKGMRVRAGGGLGDAMKVLGAVPTTVPATETYTSIERGTLDAVALPYTDSQAAYRIHEVATWFTNNLSPGTTECGLVINKDAYNKLPPQYQKLLMDIRPEIDKIQVKAWQDKDKINLPVFKKKMKEILYTPEELAKFQATAGKPVWDKWIADNQSKFDAKGLFDFMMAEIKKAQAAAPKK